MTAAPAASAAAMKSSKASLGIRERLWRLANVGGGNSGNCDQVRFIWFSKTFLTYWVLIKDS